MNEAEWGACADPDHMLMRLRGRASSRKLRLFAAACCRRAWHLLPYKRSRKAVEAVERYADGAAEARELTWAHEVADADSRRYTSHSHPAVRVAAEAVAQAAMPRARDAMVCARLAAHALGLDDLADWDAERTAQSGLLRDIFGALSFRPVDVEPAWLRWNHATVRRLAQAVYRDRRFGDLPVLADALEEAGCSDADLLGHCRGGGVHVRGCWALDLLLARK
jgi:hypothetical protein